jgi:hypothetical protein
MLRALKLMLVDNLVGIPEISEKDILCSRKYQYLAQEAERIEEKNKRLSLTAQEYQEVLKVLQEHLGSAYQRTEDLSDADKLQKFLEGKNNLIQVERVNARTSRLEADKLQKILQELRDGTVPREILETMMREIFCATITTDHDFLIMGYSQGIEKYPQIRVSRNMEYKRLFSTNDGFEIFETAARKIQPGERKEVFTILGKKETSRNFISTIYPIYSGAKLVGYNISMKPETILHSLGRKFSTKKVSELETQANTLPEGI